MTGRVWIKRLAGAVAALVALWAIWVLESDRRAVPQTIIDSPSGAVTLYGSGDVPLVIVAHGYAGSLQMMQEISGDLARSGLRVAAFDFIGHGRNTGLLSPDVTRIEGTTQQLVEQTIAITRAVRTETGWQGPIALLGHSMATDIVIRAAQELDGVAGIVAISMYSDAVTADFPQRLLILSGEWEARLREVALEAVRQIDTSAGEGDTAVAGAVERRAAVAPKVEHVGVLYSATTLAETRAWLSTALGYAPQGQGAPKGGAILALLVSLVLLGRWAAGRLPDRRNEAARLPLSAFLTVLFVPVLPAMGSALGLGGALWGVSGMRSLLIFFGVWGGVALVLLARFGRTPRLLDVKAVLLLWLACLAFALALDRYGAAFLPVGPRLAVMVTLVLGTVPFLWAERLLVAGAAVWQRILARLIPIAALTALMLRWPEIFGLLFTVLPVMVLFYLVFGTIGRGVAKRAGADAAGLGLGVVLAWSLAASTPLFATSF